jgi:hypothetical protein
VRWHGRGELTASLVLIFPALLAYEVGVLFAGTVNGADVVTRALYGALGRDAYLMLHACIAVGFVMWLRGGQRWGALRADIVAPVLLEAAIYALTLGAAISLVLDKLLGLGLDGGHAISALGAGVHEELVFRLGLLGALLAVVARSRLHSPGLAIATAFATSAVAFAAAHHLGRYGEPWTTHAFAFRCLAGLAFALVFYFRSLAHAVYAHIFYDLLVYWRG